MRRSRPTRLGRVRCLGVVLVLCLWHEAEAEAATRPLTLDDYRYFRALSIDLAGRMPTRQEVAAFEQSDFDLDAWIDGHLDGDAYAERLTRIYMDVLRLEVNPAVSF